MKAKLLREHQGERTFALVFEIGDEVMQPFAEFLRETSIKAARFSGTTRPR